MRERNHKRLILSMIGITAFLVVMHLIVNFWGTVLGNSTAIAVGGLSFDLGWWFHLDREKKFGSLFNTLLILIAAGLMVYASVRARPKKGMVLGWAMIACVLMFMACDEFFSIHEFAGQYAGIDEPMGEHVVPDWVQVMAVVVLIVMVPMGVFWWKLPAWLRIRTAIAAAVYLGGAMGGEIIASTHVMHNGFDNYTYNMLSAKEEGMEMLGMILAIDAMLLHFANYQPRRRQDRDDLQCVNLIPESA